MDRHSGCCENAGNARLAQWESACLTRRWSQVQILHRALGGPAGGHRAGECRVAQANQACAPLPDRPVLRTGNRNSLARLRRTAASFDLRCRFVKGGVPPFHTFPPVMRAANLRFGAILFFRLLGGNGWSAGLRPASRGSAKPAPTTPRHANLTARSAGLRPASRGSAKPALTTLRHANLTVERRSRTGIARERETRTDNAAPPISRWSAGLRPASRGSAKPAPTTLAPPISRWSAGLRPASRGSAKPAPTTLAPPISRPGAPVSDRHRAGARNPHRRRWPRQSHGWSAGLRPASRGSAKPAPTTLAPPISRWSAGL